MLTTADQVSNNAATCNAPTRNHISQVRSHRSGRKTVSWSLSVSTVKYLTNIWQDTRVRVSDECCGCPSSRVTAVPTLTWPHTAPLLPPKCRSLVTGYWLSTECHCSSLGETGTICQPGSAQPTIDHSLVTRDNVESARCPPLHNCHGTRYNWFLTRLIG